MNNKTLLTASAAMAPAISSGASAGTIFFDGFESPTIPDFSYGGTDGAGAVFIAGAGLMANGSGFAYADAPEGVQAAHIQSTSSIVETVGGLVSGQGYVLSFYDASRPGYSVDGLEISNGSDVIYSGTPSSSSWSLVSIDFVYNGANGDTFTITGTNTSDSDFDYNVGIDAFTIASAPEPATWALMLAGFSCLGGVLRRRNSRMAA